MSNNLSNKIKYLILLYRNFNNLKFLYKPALILPSQVVKSILNHRHYLTLATQRVNSPERAKRASVSPKKYLAKLGRNSAKFLKEILPMCPIALVSIFFLVLPNIADAIVGTGIFDPFKAALLGIDAKTTPVSFVLIIIFFLYAATLTLLWVATGLFDRVIWLNREMVGVDGPMVMFGWEFVSGLANMFLILIFIAVAFAIILKIESFQAKKILPRLIIVALLLNFSLLFIGMLIDVANIAYATFLPAIGRNLMGEFMRPFLASGLVSVGAQAMAIITTVKLYSVPFIAPFAQISVILGITTIFLPFILTLLFQIIIFTILIGMFFLYIFIFGARIFVIQILAILSPLAFLCLILPQTKKYWDEWLKWFLGWLLAGIFLLFFLRLGFLAFGLFQDELMVGVIPWFHNLGAYFMFYLFVVIYLGATAFLAKKFMPEGAQAMIDQGKALMTSGAKIGAPLLGGLKRQVAQEAEKYEEFEEKLATQKTPPTVGQIAGISIARPMAWASRLGFRLSGTTSKVYLEKEQLEEIKKAGDEVSGLSSEAKKSLYDASRPGSARRLGIVLQAIDENDYDGMDLTDDQKIQNIEIAVKLRRKGKVRAANPILFSQSQKEPLEEVIKKIQIADLKFVSNDDINDEEFIEALSKTPDAANRINTLAITKGSISIDSICKNLNALASKKGVTLEEYIEKTLNKPELIKYFNGAGQRFFGGLLKAPTPRPTPPLGTPSD